MGKFKMTKEIAYEIHNKLSDCKEAQQALRKAYPEAFKDVHLQLESREKPTPLSNYETEELGKVMEMLESDEKMFANVNGGYAECKLVGVDEEEVQIDLEFGKQDMGAGDGEDHVDNITLSRKALADKGLTIRGKVGETT